MGKTNYLAFLGHAPLLPIEDADGAYAVFAELLDQPIPPKNVSILMRSGSKVEPLCDESGIADGWKSVNSRPLVSHRVAVAYNTTAFPRSSLNRDGTLLSTWGLVIESVEEWEPSKRFK